MLAVFNDYYPFEKTGFAVVHEVLKGCVIFLLLISRPHVYSYKGLMQLDASYNTCIIILLTLMG